jgi:mono/diheme cytochrome c family protein
MKLSIKQLKTAIAGAMTLSILALVISSQTTSQAASPVAADAAATFKAKCAGCHGMDGSGNTAPGKSMKVRDLRSADVQKQSDDQLFAIISNGKGKMPAYSKSLGADACKGLVAHVRKLGGK